MAASLIFKNKNEALAYLNGLTGGYDGKHVIARYWTSGNGSDIASVEGIIHNTNSVYNVEIKDGSSSGGSGSSAGKQVVIKKAYPVFPVSYLNYYYEGQGFKFQVPKLRCDDVLQIILPGYFSYPLIPNSFNSRDNLGYAQSFIKQAQRVKIYDSEGSLQSNLKYALGTKVVQLAYKKTDDSVVITIHGNRLPNQRSFILPQFSLTMFPGSMSHFLVRTTGDDFIKTFTKDDLETAGYIVDSAYSSSSNYFKTAAEQGIIDCWSGSSVRSDEYWEYDNGIRLIQLDFRDKIEIIETGNRLNTETTSPGFIIESGKIKCYKSSDLQYVFDRCKGETTSAGKPLWYPESILDYRTQCAIDSNFLNDIKVGKDSTILYYNLRGIRNGLSPRNVLGTHKLMNQIFGKDQCFGDTTRMYKEEGRAEYLGTRRIGRKVTMDAEKIWFYVTYTGVDTETGMRVFTVSKSDSEYPFRVLKIGVKFVGTDGFTKDGYFNVLKITNIDDTPIEIPSSYMDIGDNSIPSSEGDYKIYCQKSLIIKRQDENDGNLFERGNDSGDYGGSIYPIYATFDWLREKPDRQTFTRIPKKPILFTKMDPHRYQCKNYGRRAKPVWKVLNRRVKQNGYFLPAKFMRNYFNRCRYYRKYKGVKSEIPEYFYTR